ncbi:MAG: hypothetical protein J6R18_04510 [Kiritimatiellae bacterium]|nr:hypothetical protein [Kiritimatiellia bacterium]
MKPENTTKSNVENLAVGFFDGVHLGHQRILRNADAVLTFRNHPLSVLNPGCTPSLIMDPDDRIGLLKVIGANKKRRVKALKFTRRYASMPPSDFACYLRKEFPDLSCIHCGANWRFGAEGKGTPQTLRKLGFNVKVFRYAKFDGAPISSTRIRAALADGDIKSVNAMLGRPYSSVGNVVKGKGMGRKIGFPTINLRMNGALNLKYGVYAVNTPYGSGIANYGIAPTMGENAWHSPIMEVHLLDKDLSGHFPEEGAATVEMVGYIRPERKFRNQNELAVQISKDISAARGLMDM